GWADAPGPVSSSRPEGAVAVTQHYPHGARCTSVGNGSDEVDFAIAIHVGGPQVVGVAADVVRERGLKSTIAVAQQYAGIVRAVISLFTSFVTRTSGLLSPLTSATASFLAPIPPVPKAVTGWKVPLPLPSNTLTKPGL
nr:hypothetical protein [Tanacetum cinerariifolium]